MERILVTGANGLLATNTIHALIAAGYMVRGTLRDRKKYRGISSPALELSEGDFTDTEFIAQAVRGCSGVIHCAACTSTRADMEEYRRVNVTATGQLLEASCRAGLRRIVNISSANIFAYGTKEHPGDESRPSIPPFSLSGYTISKQEAQEVVREFEDRIEIVTLCPTFMIGPYDSRPSSGRIIIMGYHKALIPCPPGGKNFVAVQDVASCAVSALVKGTPGQAYMVAGDNLSYREFYSILKERTDGHGLLINIPAFLLRAAGKTGDMLSRLFNIRTEVTSVNMEMLCTGNYNSCRKAEAELGFKHRPASEAIDEAICWFRQAGMISSI